MNFTEFLNKTSQILSESSDKHGWNPKHFKIIAHRHDKSIEEFGVEAITSTQDAGYRDGDGKALMTIRATTKSPTNFPVNIKIPMRDYQYRKTNKDHPISVDSPPGIGRSAYSHYTIKSI
jgi:hypothetical protein